MTEVQRACLQAAELLRKGQAAGALLQAKTAIDIGRGDPNAWLIFARCLAALGEFDACYNVVWPSILSFPFLSFPFLSFPFLSHGLLDRCCGDKEYLYAEM